MGVLPGPREQYVGLLAPCPLCPLQTCLGAPCLGTLTGLASLGSFEMTLFSKAHLSLCAKSVSQSEMTDFMHLGKKSASCLAFCD